MQTLRDFTHQRCTQLIAAACGESLPDVEIRTVKTWVMGVQIADAFQVQGSLHVPAHARPPAFPTKV